MTPNPARDLRTALLTPLRTCDASRSDEEIEAQFVEELESARKAPDGRVRFLPALVLVTFGHHHLIEEIAAFMPPADTALARVADGLRRVFPLPEGLVPSRDPARLASWYRERHGRLAWNAEAGRYELN